MRIRTNFLRLVPLLCAAYLLWFGPESARSVSAQCRSANVNAGISDPINPNLEFNEYAAISVDARDPNCKDTAASKLTAKLAATLGHGTVQDDRIGTRVTPFKTWLAGDMVTHIFRAALSFERWRMFVSPSLLQQVEADFAGIPSPQDPGCGLRSLPSVNSCMDDFALTASGFGWIAAWENRRNAGGGHPENYVSNAQAAISQALSRMTDHGGGPCFYVVGSNPIRCDGDFGGPGGPVKIIGADHTIENPAYGFGLMTSIASACVGLYVAGSPCAFGSNQATVATELMRSAQERLTPDASQFTATGCLNFTTGAFTANCADTLTVPGYLPTDFAMQRFYDKKGIPRPNPSLYQFTGYSPHPPQYNCGGVPCDALSDFWSYNRQEIYGVSAFGQWAADAEAPVVTFTSPSNGATLSGIVTLAVNATDNLKVSRVEIYANGYRLAPTYSNCSLVPNATAILSPPWQLCVDTSNGSVDGTYTLTANAYDDAGNVAISVPITITVLNRSCQPGSAGDSATFVSQSGIPPSMLPGSTANVSVTMRNTGTTCWTETGMYRLGSQNPQDNGTWGLGRVYLNPGETISPGQTKTFSFTIRAPSASGTYNFQWRMVHELVQWFGDFTPNVTVIVSGPDTVAPVVTWLSPANGATLSGVVTLAVNATDNVRVSKVEMYANGTRLTPTYSDCSPIPGATAILNPPYRLCADTSNGSVDGTYTLTAKAYDDAGNVGTSAPITITVANPRLALSINRTSFHTTDRDWTITIHSSLVGSSVTLIEEYWNGSYWQEDWRGGIGQIPSTGTLTFVDGAPYFAASFRSHVEAGGSASNYVSYSVTP